MASKNAKGGKKEDAGLTLEAITALFQQHREDLASEITTSANMLSSKLDQVRQALEEQAERVSSLELAAEDLSQRVSTLEESCAALREDNAKLKDKVSDLEGPPRPVIIRLHRYQTKELIIREARRRGKLDYRGASLRIVEDYSPDVLSRRVEYKDVMIELYKRGLKPALLFPARLRITQLNGAKKFFGSVEEAQQYIKKLPKASANP